MKTLKNRFGIRVMILFLFVFATAFTTKITGGPTWKAPATADVNKNPLKGNASSAAQGKITYTTYCAACHGSKGKGDGVAASGLQKPPADHTSKAIQSQSDGAIFWKMSEGHNPMPAYKGMLSENQRWQLVCFIRTLAKK
jgi:mono/diheme cytochrome c family protein